MCRLWQDHIPPVPKELTGTTTFYDNANSEASSILQPIADVAWKGKTVQQLEVPVCPLHALLDHIPAHLPIELLQTNIEGFDLAAIKTAGSALARVQLVLSEMDVNGFEVSSFHVA